MNKISVFLVMSALIFSGGYAYKTSRDRAKVEDELKNYQLTLKEVNQLSEHRLETKSNLRIKYIDRVKQELKYVEKVSEASCYKPLDVIVRLRNESIMETNKLLNDTGSFETAL